MFGTRLDTLALGHWLLALRPPWSSAAAKAVDGAVQDTLQLVRPEVIGLKRDAQRSAVRVETATGEHSPSPGRRRGSLVLPALVADLADRAQALNRAIRHKALAQTGALVLIDELELHVHLRAQRGVVGPLRGHFPAPQFVATSDSPFIAQALRGGHELPMLEGQSTAVLGNLSIEAIASSPMGADEPTAGIHSPTTPRCRPSEKCNGLRSSAAGEGPMMRPTRSGPSPQTEGFAPCVAALAPLVERLGTYCGYCERRIPTRWRAASSACG